MRLLFSIITISALKLVATHFSWYFSWLSTLRQSFLSVGSSISQASLSQRHSSMATNKRISRADHHGCKTFRILPLTAPDRYNTLGQQPNSQLMDDGTPEWIPFFILFSLKHWQAQQQLPGQSSLVYLYLLVDFNSALCGGNGKHLLSVDKPAHISSWQTWLVSR